ncbi:MAG: GNAT family N-acetyltransferase [Arenimonas sp.]
MSAYWTQPVTLSGKHARLEPLAIEHASGLRAALADGELWRLWYTAVPTPDALEEYMETALRGQQAGTELPFVVRDGAGEIVGCTRYCRIEQGNHRLEIGYTWYSQRVQRSALNTEAKRLLLGHAFDSLKAIAVEFRTDWFNQRSRAAIARLGAKQDGVLRNAFRRPDGSIRDTVVFSIIESEWPTVRTHLDYQLARDRSLA